MVEHQAAEARETQADFRLPRRRFVLAAVCATVLSSATPVQAASCTVEILEFDRYEKRSGACTVDEASNTVSVYDAEYWGSRGRKLLVPQAPAGRRAASFVAISPTDLRANEVAHAMSYRVVVKTGRGLYRFLGQTPTTTYQSRFPPTSWWRQRPGEKIDDVHALTTAEMLAELTTLEPDGPALSPAVVEQVISQNQNLADRLPMLAGIGNTKSAGAAAAGVAASVLADLGDWAPVSAEQQAAETRAAKTAARQKALEQANRAATPVASPALDELISRMQSGAR